MKRFMKILALTVLLVAAYMVGRADTPVEVPNVVAKEGFKHFSDGQSRELKSLLIQINRNQQLIMEALRTHTH